MLNLVTLTEAREHLRAEDCDNGWLATFVPAISQAVATWLKDEWRLYVPAEDSSGDVALDDDGNPVPTSTVQPVVKAAVLLELASAYRYREGEGKDNVVPASEGYGYVLNKASTALLAPLRKSTVA